MLTVIIDARTQAAKLPALLAQLTAGAVDGLVRQVLIVAGTGQAGIEALCDETGAEAYAALDAAATAARAEWLMVLPADFRLRDGWISTLSGHVDRGPALIRGLADGGLFAPRPFGVLVERSCLGIAQGADLKGLRRGLGFNPRRTG